MKCLPLVSVCCLVSMIFTPVLRGEEMIDMLRTLFKGKEPVSIGTCEDVRELKYPGQKYWHVMDMTVSGQGQVVTPRCFGWFKTRKVVHFVHSSKLVLSEEVISTPQELEKGIIRTKFAVLRLDEELGIANGEFAIGRFSSKDIFADFKTFCEKHGSDQIEKNPWAWQNFVPGVRVLNKFLIWSDKQINSDGTIVLGKRDLNERFPDMEQLVSKFRDLTDTKIYSTWEFGKGYTSIRFESPRLDRETKEALAKLIYRTNPISVKEILPDGKRSGDKWTIDSDTIGGIVFDLGLDFDDVDGMLSCCHRGAELKDGEELPDEFELLKKQPLRLQALEIPRDERNLLSLIARGERTGSIAISFSPWGSFSIFDDHDKNGRHLYYLKEAHMEGVLKSKVKRKTSLLKDVEFRDANLKIMLNYSQMRFGD